MTKTADDTHPRAPSPEKREYSPGELEAVHSLHTVDSKTPQTGYVGDIDDGFDPKVVRKLTRKVDLRLIPVLGAMYCISLVDRNNLSLARQANHSQMDTDLKLKQGNAYSLIAMAFFVPYIILEIPSQVCMRKFGARVWLGSAVTCWGIVMIGMGFAPTWRTLAGLRAMLGAFEATLFPGAAFLLGCWYPRKQMSSRNVWFYVSSKAISGWSSILMYAFSLIHGHGGLHGWQWIFVLCGVITVLIGIMGYVFLVDFPDRASFLSPEEKEIIAIRIERDRGDSVADQLTLKKLGRYAIDLKLWIFAFFFCSTTLASYSMSYFAPRLLSDIGFNNVESLLLTCPPYFYSIIPALITGYLSDKKKWRAGCVGFNALQCVVGIILFSYLPRSSKGGRYFGMFLAWGGCNSNVPLVVAWAQTTIRSQSKRGFTAALVVAWGGIGGILASLIFKQSESPSYPTGIQTTLGFNAATVLGCVGMHFWFKYQNRRADEGKTVIEGDVNFRYQG